MLFVDSTDTGMSGSQPQVLFQLIPLLSIFY